VVDGPVFDPATGKAGEPENDAGESGKQNRAAAKRIEGLDGIVRCFGGEKRFTDGELPENAENNRAAADGDDISECGSELGAEDALDVADEFVDLGSILEGCLVASARWKFCIRTKLIA
jgi:hypothetical protein